MITKATSDKSERPHNLINIRQIIANQFELECNIFVAENPLYHECSRRSFPDLENATRYESQPVATEDLGQRLFSGTL